MLSDIIDFAPAERSKGRFLFLLNIRLSTFYQGSPTKMVDLP